VSRLFGRYREFFALPDVTRMVAMAMLARMPLGTQGLALLLHVRAITGSYAIAGSTVGTYLAAAAVTAPIVGRIVDRIGPHAPLVITGCVSPLALAVLLAARPLALTPALILAAAAVAGAFAPPITVLTRTMWRYRFEHDDTARRTAFAVDAVLVELAFTVGPALVALVLALAGPVASYAMALVFATLAVPVFMASPALRYWRVAGDAERHLLGPLTAPRLLVVYAATVLLTFCLGLLEVGYPGFATAAGITALSGVLLAINSTGSALGGLAYGGLHLAMPVERQLPRLLLLLAAALAVQVLVSPAWLLALCAFAAGVFIAPSLTAVTLLVSANAPARYATEAFTWSSTCIVSGVGAGVAVGGALVERLGPHAVFGTAALGALAAAAVALALTPRPAVPPAAPEAPS
jgi:MFS family permease